MMKRHLALFLAGGLVVGPILAFTVTATGIELTPEERAACDREGGCAVLTLQALAKMHEAVRAKTLLGCKGAT